MTVVDCLKFVRVIPRAGFARRRPVWLYKCAICGTERRIVQGWSGPAPAGWPHITCNHEKP